MAILPKIYAVNVGPGGGAAPAIPLPRLGLTIPIGFGSTLELTLTAWIEEIHDEEALYNAIVAGTAVLSYGEGNLSKGESLNFFNVISQQVRANVRAMDTAGTNFGNPPSGNLGNPIDTSVAIAANDRILLTNDPNTPVNNGLWVAHAGAWTRPQDFNTADAASGAIVYVEEGTDHKEETWVCTAITGSDLIGTSSLTWEQTSGSGATTLQEAYDAGNTIETAGGVDIAFTLTSGNFTVDDGSVTFGATTALDDFSVETGTMSLDSTDTTHLTMSANSAGNKTLTLSATNSGGGTGLIDLSSTGTTNVDADGGIALESTGGNLDIGSDSDDGDINVGIGTTAGRAITIGNKTGDTGVTIEATQTGQITLDAPNTTITGDLVVQGVMTTVETEEVNVWDNFFYMNANYTTVSPLTGGLVINYLPTVISDTVAATGFHAHAGAANPYVNTTGAGTFTPGDFIQNSAANNSENNGLYQVLTHAAGVLTVCGLGASAGTFQFTQNEFATDPTVAGVITKVNIAVLRVSSTGVWQIATGSNATTLVFQDILTAANIDLQTAYEGGNTIEVTAAEGPLAITLTSDDFTVDGANDVSFGGITPIATFNVDSAGSVTFDGVGTANLTTDTGTLTLSTTTSGDVVVSAADNVTLDAVSGSFSLDGVVASNVTVTGDDLTLSTLSSGDVLLDSVDAVSIDATTASHFTVTGAADLTLSSSAGSVVVDGGEAAADAIYLHASNAAGGVTIDAGTVGAGTFDVNVGSGGITLDSTGAISLDGVGASNFTTTTGGITLSAGAGDVNVTATTNSVVITGNEAISDAVTINALPGGAGGVDINAGSGGITLDTASGGGISLDAIGAASNFTVTGAFDLTLSSTLGRAILQSGKAAADSVYLNASGVAGGVKITSGTERVLIDGVHYYGKSAGVPTPAPTGGYVDGDKYYDTNFQMEMRYYGAPRSKWLSVEAQYIQFGRNGACASGQYYRGPDGRILSNTLGFIAPHNGTIVGLGFTRSNVLAATFDVVEGGVVKASVATGALAALADNTLNGDFSANGILAVLNNAGGNNTQDVVAWLKVQWRTTP
jgi:hypothetical protein